MTGEKVEIKIWFMETMRQAPLANDLKICNPSLTFKTISYSLGNQIVKFILAEIS